MSVKNYKKLYLRSKKSDVTLVIGDYELPAHRFILSERSEYFKTMFSSNFIEARSDKITLKETDLKTFESVLKYIYTGKFNQLHDAQKNRIHSDELFEILVCARFYMVDNLALEVISHIKKIESVDICLLLNKAFAYTEDDLIVHAADMMWNGKRCFSSPTFKQLSPEALEYLLKLRLDEHESTIFKSLVKWMRNNLEHKALFPKFLEHIDLCLIKKKLLDKLFKPQQLIDRNFYENLLKEHQNKANTVQKVVNQNVITGTDDLRIIEGYKFWRREWDTVYLYACIVNPRFIIDLKQQNLLNCIKLTLLDEASYVVSVSKDMCDWERVVDHSDYLCFGPQVLYFEERAFRFIRIQCNARFLKVDPNIEALHSTGPFEIDPITTLIMPNQNIVPTEMEYACSNTANGYIEGNIMNGYVMHWMDNNSRIIFQFSQPYLIGSIKLLLNYTSSYSVAIYANGERFTRIFDEKNVSGWRTVTFPKQPVMCIKIVGFKAPSHTFRLHKLECPAT